MASLYVTEFSNRLSASGVPTMPPIAQQKVTFTGTAGVSAAFNVATRTIRVQADGICSVRVFSGATSNATVSDMRLTAGQTEWFAVAPGAKISAITNT